MAVIGGTVTALAGGLLVLAERAAEAGDQIFEASERTGLSAEQLSGVKALTHELGGNFDALTISLGRMGVNLQNSLIEPGEVSAKVLAKAGITTQFLADKSINLGDKVQMVMHKAFAMDNEWERNEILQAALGRGWQGNLEALKALAEHGYAPAIAQAKQFGFFFDEKAAANAHNFTVEMNTLKGEFSGMALTLGKEVIPYAESFAAWLHAVSINAQVSVHYLEAFLEATTNPIAAVWNLHKATQLQNAAFEEENDWLIKLQMQMKAAADVAKDLPPALGGTDPAAAKAADKAYQMTVSLKDQEDTLAQALARTRAQTEQATHAREFQNQVDIQTLNIIDDINNVMAKQAALARTALPTFVEGATVTQHMSAAMKEYHMLTQDATAFSEQFTGAIKDQIAATQADLAGSVEGLSKGLAGLIGGRKAQAAVEAIWETAKGIACIAEGTWPPNPAAIVAAGLHFEAAAQYAILAGKGSHHRAAAGGSYAGARGSEHGGHGGADRGGLPPPSTLASGASGRFGTANVVVFGSDHELNMLVAGAVNGAHNEGIGMTVNYAARGTPVGH